jgi:hypothetical protein
MIVIQWIEGVAIPDDDVEELQKTLASVEELERRPGRAARTDRMEILEKLAVDPQAIMHSGDVVRGRYWVMCTGDPPHLQSGGTWGSAVATAGVPRAEGPPAD